MATAKIHVSVGPVFASIETDQSYPDAVSDMVNRISVLLATTLAQIQASGIDITKIKTAAVPFDFIEYDDEDDD